MPKIELQTVINAPVEKCFDLARSIDLHLESTKQTGEQAIAGRTSGLIVLGETVTWRAKHFGIWLTLSSKITQYQCPELFVDEMVAGAFKSFRHEHHFLEAQGYTIMKDMFIFESPLWILGKLADILFLKNYMTKLLTERNRVIKEVAELNEH